MKKILMFSIFILIISAPALFAQALEEIYRKANLSYEDKDYEKAISMYEELISMDKASPEVFYNLGNSYFKLKKIGKAILNYQRALKLAPGDGDIQHNLKMARAMAIDKINAPERGFALNAALFVYDRMNVNQLTIACSVFYFLVVLVLILSIYFVAKRRMMFYTAGALGMLFLIFLIFLFAKIHNENFTKNGVIVTEKIDVRSGPKDDYLLQFSLHEGTGVKIVKESQGWYEIKLSKDLKGWIPKTSVDII